jgi:hypothetical protein
MPTVAEQWIEQGFQQGFVHGFRPGVQLARRKTVPENIAFGLELKFGAEGTHMLPAIHDIDDVNVLRALWQAGRTAASLDQFQMIYGKMCS